MKPQASLRATSKDSKRPERALSAGGSRKGPRKQYHSVRGAALPASTNKESIHHEHNSEVIVSVITCYVCLVNLVAEDGLDIILLQDIR